MKEPPMVLHYDGKIVHKFNKRIITRDRIAVSVSCVGKNMLLVIPPCISSTGEWQNQVKTDLLKSYELKWGIVGMVFNTTPSNTCTRNGVDIRLNQHF